MKPLTLLIIVLCFGCGHKAVHSNTRYFPVTPDTLYKEGNRLVMGRSDTINGLSYTTVNGTSRFTVSLDKQKIPYKHMTEALWVNDDYACSMTWWSQSFCRMIFLPMKPGREFIYLDKSIEQTDAINNNIVYVDKVHKKSIVFGVENLITRKKKRVSVSTDNEDSSYPYYDTIIMNRDEVIIKTNRESVVTDLRDLY